MRKGTRNVILVLLSSCFIATVFETESVDSFIQTLGNANEDNFNETLNGSKTNLVALKNSSADNTSYTIYRLLGTEYCSRKSQCGGNCNCDVLCRQFGHCCADLNETITFSETSIQKYQMQCINFSSESGSVSALMVSECHQSWTDNKTKQLCYEADSSDDILLTVPVSSNDGDFIFRNMYCAYCNHAFDFKFWIFRSICENGTINNACIVYNFEPNNTRHNRVCGNENSISSCSKFINSTSFNKTFNELCDSGSFSLVYGQNSISYKNKYCEMCNKLDEQSLFCDRRSFKETFNNIYSYRQLVDFNSRQYVFETQKGTFFDKFKSCFSIHDEIYDPVSKTCRKLYCPKSFTAVKGKCLSNLRSSKRERNKMCAFIRLQPDEYDLENSTSILVLPLNMTISSTRFFRNGTDVFVCADIFKTHVVRQILIHFDASEKYVSLCGLICSIISLVITLLVYMMFPELRNIPGKNLISLILALLLAQFLFLCSNQAVNNVIACKALAIIVHYFFLASFSWMNIIAFDLFVTFSHAFQLNRSNTHMSNNYFMYSLYGWLVPATIILTAILLDNCNITDEFKPRYGENACLISSKKALIVFFLCPLAVFKLFDIVGFTCASFHISKSRRQASMARRYNLCSFFLYLKLSFIMGLTWLFAFVAVFSNNAVMWFLFIVFNTLQGVFIALGFLCTKRVKSLIRKKMSRRQTSDSSSGTRMTQLQRAS